MFPPLISSPPSLTALRYFPQYPSSSSSHQSIHICFYSSPPPLLFHHSLSPLFCLPLFPLEIVICKALCSDSPYLCRGVAASLSLSPFLSIPHEVLAQTGTFSSCTEKKQTMRTTLKQQNLSSKEFCLSHAEIIFFTRLKKLPITKWNGGGGSGYDSSLQKSQDRVPRSPRMQKTNLEKCYYF